MPADIRESIRRRYHWQTGTAWKRAEYRNPADGLPEREWYDRLDRTMDAKAAEARRMENETPVPVQCIETGKVFDSVQEALKWLRSIGRCQNHSITRILEVAGTGRPCGGYRWQRPGTEPIRRRYHRSPVRRTDTGEEYPNAASAADVAGVARSTFCLALQAGRLIHGVRWERVA